MRCRALRVRPFSDPDALPLACDGCAPVADKYNVLRLYKKPAHTNEDVANVATVYVAPASLLLHLCLASYFYTVVVRARAHTHAHTHTHTHTRRPTISESRPPVTSLHALNRRRPPPSPLPRRPPPPCQVLCPYQLACEPSAELTVTYVLMAVAAGIVLLVRASPHTPPSPPPSPSLSPSLAPCFHTHTFSASDPHPGSPPHVECVRLSFFPCNAPQVWHPLQYEEPREP